MQGVGAGQVVAGRYRLNNRRAHIGEIDVWTATDDTLGREVEITVLPTSLPNSGDIVDAARQSAAVPDHRLVRVLDVGSDITMSWVVEESLTETRTLASLLETGALPPEEARRIAGETATALASAARRHNHHLHLTPHAIRLTDAGLIKVAGLGVASAIDGTDEDFSDAEAERHDVRSVVAVLYAAMTCRWPLPTRVRGIDPAPRVGAGVAAPSELVVAVPGALDALCRATLNQNSGPKKLAELVEQLRPWSPTRVTKVTHPAGASSSSTGATAASSSTPASRKDDTDSITPVASAPTLTQRVRDHRQARLDAERRDLEERRADPTYLNVGEALATEQGVEGPETSIAPGLRALPVRDGRFSAPIITTVVGGVLLATAFAVPTLLNTFSDSTSPAPSATAAATAPNPTTAAPAGSPSPTASPTSTGNVEIADVTTFDPDGDGTENPGAASLAVDGDTNTGWRTERYDDAGNVGGNKVGVGLVVQLANPSTVNGVRVNGSGGQNFTVYVNSSPSLDGATEIGSVSDAPEGESDLVASAPTGDARYVIVLLTRLPAVENGYRGQVNEIAVY